MKLGIQVLRTREPGGTPFGENVRELLLDPNAPSRVDRADLLLLARSEYRGVQRYSVTPSATSPALGRAARELPCDALNP